MVRMTVVLLDAGFARGSVLIHHRHLNAVFFLQLQSAQSLGGDICDVDAEIGTRVRIIGGNAEGLRGINRPSFARPAPYRVAKAAQRSSSKFVYP